MRKIEKRSCNPILTPLSIRPPSEERSKICLAEWGKLPTNAWIAQLVEQLAFNQLVLGSSPSPRTINFKGGSLFRGCPFLFLRLFSFGVDWDIEPTEEAFGSNRRGYTKARVYTSL